MSGRAPIVRQKSSRKLNLIAAFVAVFALVAQPMYGVFSQQIAQALEVTPAPTAVPAMPSVSGDVIYNTISPTLPSSYPSQGYAATSTSALGDKITFAGSGRDLDEAAVVMTSWACENGVWHNSCVTTPGATFSQELTLNIYNVNSDGTIASELTSKTQTFEIPYRPTTDPTCVDANKWRNTNGDCQTGYNHVVVFDLDGVTVPDTVIYSLAFNTKNYGANPTGENGPYNSLNLGLNTDASAPYVGTDTVSDELYWDSTYLGRSAGLATDTGWDPYQVAAMFTSKPVDATAPTVEGVVLNGKNVSLAPRDDNCGPTDFNIVSGKVSLSANITDESGVKSAKYKIRKVTDGGCTQAGIYNSRTVNMNNQSGDNWTTLSDTELDTEPVPADGSYTIQMTVEDELGNSATKYVDITVDNKAPDTPVISKPTPRQWFNGSSTVNSWTASDDESGVEGYEVKYEFEGRSDATRFETGLSRTQTFSGSYQGPITISVRAKDNAGNWSAYSKSVTYNYDSKDPATDIKISPVVDGEFTVSGDASDNLALNRVYVQLVSREDGQRYGGTTINLIPEGKDGHWSKIYDVKALGWPEGDYAAHVSVTDRAGNSADSGWTDNFLVEYSPVLTGDYFVPHTDHLGVGFTIDRFDDATKVEVALFETGETIPFVVNVGESIDMKALLNSHTGQISSPFYIPGQDDDNYWTFGSADWRDFTPAYAIVTVFYGDGEMETQKINLQASELGYTYDALVAGYVAGISDDKTTTVDTKKSKEEKKTSRRSSNVNRPAPSRTLNLLAASGLPNPGMSAAFGTQDIENDDESKEDSPATDKQEVKSAQTDANEEDLADENEEAGFLLGLAWYWWILLGLAVASLLWWTVAAIRRRSES